MKKFLFIIITAAAVCGCTKDNSQNGGSGAVTKVFTCTVENATKTTLDGVDVKWQSGDEIRINGSAYELSSGEGTTSAEFKLKESEPATTFPYYAFYANGVTENTWDETAKTYSLPASYAYKDNSFNMPMYAYNEDSENLNFKNICGVMRLKLSAACGLNTVQSITVSSDKQLNGAFTATPEGVMTFTGSGESGTKTTGISFETAVGLTSGETAFYVPIPPASHRLNVKVSGGGLTKSMTMTTAVTFQRNKIYNLGGGKLKDYTGGNPADAR